MRTSSAIKVVARFRPPNALERSQSSETVVSFDSEDTLSLDMKSVCPNFPSLRVYMDRS